MNHCAKLPPLILASASPRRRELLAQAGVSFTCHPAHLDEATLPGEAPAATVQRLARAKAAAVAARYPRQIVLGADTMVVRNGRALGKPESLDEAREMLRFLSGHAHEVLTGVSLLRLEPPLEETWMALTRVRFHQLADAAIEEYLARVHTLDKAGAYAIQEHGDRLVAEIDGLFSNVVGLPVEDVVARLKAISA